MADNDTSNQAPSTEKKEEVVKPEYIQDKFWDKDSSKVNVESLASSYNSLEKKLGERTEEITKQVRSDLETERAKNTPSE